MLHPQQLHDYQRKAILHQLYHNESMLWLGMSLGKTAITLTTIDHRMRCGQVKKTLVVAPLRVCHAVWEREARKWSHLQHLRFSLVVGDEERRKRQLFGDADIYLINYENLAWLSNQLDHFYISQGKPLPFQMLVYDEVSKMKNAQAKRSNGGKKIKRKLFVRKPNEPSEDDLKKQGLKGKQLREKKEQITLSNYKYYLELRKLYHTNKDENINKSGFLVVVPEISERLVGWSSIVPHFHYRTGLTGTPAANGYLDLHGQYLAVDGGTRLGEYISHYRDAYFIQGYDGWTYQPSELGKQWIEHKIGDITLKMDTADYLELPPIIYNDIMVDMPPAAMRQYKEVEQEMFTRLDDGTEIEVFNKASVSNKCLQFANGSPYKEPMKPDYTVLHDAKFEALDDILEEAGGDPVLVSYTFKADALEMMKRYKHLKPVNLTDTPAAKLQGVIRDCEAGKIKMLIGHPASMGHGVDGLQDSVDTLVWFGLNWSLELYEQMIARVWRQGRSKPTTVHRILCNDTIDVAVSDALRRKDGDQTGLKQAIQRYRDGLIPATGAMSFL